MILVLSISNSWLASFPFLHIVSFEKKQQILKYTVTA